jgi:hypothetical protein
MGCASAVKVRHPRAGVLRHPGPIGPEWEPVDAAVGLPHPIKRITSHKGRICDEGDVHFSLDEVACLSASGAGWRAKYPSIRENLFCLMI